MRTRSFLPAKLREAMSYSQRSSWIEPILQRNPAVANGCVPA